MCRTIFFSMHRLYIVQRRNIRRFLRKFIQYVAYLNFSFHQAYELVKRLIFSLNYPPSFLRSAWYEPCIFNLSYLQWDSNPYKHFCSSDFLTTLAFTQANLAHSAMLSILLVQEFGTCSLSFCGLDYFITLLIASK